MWRFMDLCVWVETGCAALFAALLPVYFVSSCLISSGRSVLLVHRVQCFYGSCFCRFARRNKTSYGAGDNDEQRGLHADGKTHGGIDEHFLLKHARI